MIALVGRPNSGKTTLFNWLTGSKFRTVNYPGATVECFLGETHERYGAPTEVIDTPGTYSLFPKSPDEEVTYNALFNNYRNYKVEGVIVVLDATQWQRQLSLVEQVKESGFPAIIALTMTDLLQDDNVQIDTDKLSKYLGLKIICINGRLGGGVLELVEELRGLPAAQAKVVPPQAWTEEKYRSIKLFAEQLTKQIQPEKKELSRLKYFERTQKLDHWLLHPFFGLFLFFAIMMALFSSIFWLADPFMSFIDNSFSWLADMILQLGGHNIVADLLANGFVASAGAVFVFVPQIFILFAGISFLEDSGYLARAATLIDKPFSRVGMSGRSFVPLLSGYACAVPAMMATRNIRSSKERWIAMFIIPLMTCSARLPVYALLLSFIFFGEAAWKPGLALAGLYFGSLVVGSLAAAIVNKIIGKTKQNSFLIELPYYHRPSLRVILRTAVIRTLAYIRRAGPVIFILAFLVWTGSTFPRLDGVTEAEQLEGSFIGHLGKIIEPVFEPMGSDWRVGIGLISAFAAREVFVSTLAVVFNIASENETSLSESLIAKMKAASWPDGTPLFTFSSVAAILVFFMVALQCLSTFAMAQREMHSWQFAIVQLVVLNLVAYLLAIGTYQALHFLG